MSRSVGSCSGSVLSDELLTFPELIGKFRNRVFSIAQVLLADTKDADSVALRVFAAMYQQAHKGSREREFAVRVYAITIRRCFFLFSIRRLRCMMLSIFRQRSRREEVLRDCDRSEVPPLLSALSFLPFEDRALLGLREVVGAPVETITAIMHLRTAVVRRRLLVARRRLADALAQLDKRGVNK